MASAASAAAPSSLSRPGSDMSDSIAHPRGDFHRTWGLRPGEPGARLYIVLFDISSYSMSVVVGGGVATRASPATVTETGGGAPRWRARRQSQTAKAMITALVAREMDSEGEMAASEIAVSNARVPQPSGVNMCPASAAQSAEIPMTAQTNVTTIVSQSPFMSSAGWWTNRKGARNPPMPMRVACQPVVIGLALAI